MNDNPNESTKFDPLENDDWYDMHVVPKINEIEYQDSGHYFINVMLCWNRHRFRDAYEGKLSLAVFPGSVMVPQKWQPNFACCPLYRDFEGQTRVLRTTFCPCRFSCLPFRCSRTETSFTTCLRGQCTSKGSTLRRCALHLGIHSYVIQRKDEEIRGRPNNLLPSCGVGHKRGYAERKVSDLSITP